MNETRRLSNYLRSYRLWVILAPLMMALEVAMDLLQPLLIERIIDEGIAQSDLDIVRETGLIMIGVALIGMIGGVLCGVFAIRAAQGFGADLRGSLFRKVQDLSFGNLDRLETGGLITRLTNDVTQLTEMVGMLLRIMVRAPLLLVGSTIMAVIISPKLALLFLVLIPLIAVVIGVIIRIAYPLFKVVQKKLDHLNTVMQENLAGVRVVRVFARGGHEIGRFHTANTDLMETTLSVIKYIVIVMPILMFIINLGIVATLWFGGHLINSGDMEVGQLIAFSNYLLQSLMSIMMVSMLVMRFARAEASAGRVNEVLDSVPEVTNPPIAIEEFRPRGRVEFDNVSFSYDDESEPVLRDITFTVEPGQTIAILGATGSGKSSLVNLIPRFYDPQQGAIRIDGIDVRDIEEVSLRSTIALALQESVLFTGTVRDNIRFGRPDGIRWRGRRGSPDGPGLGLHQRVAGHLRFDRRPAWRQSLRWPEAAHRDCPRPHPEGPDPDPRRQHQRGRCRDRGPDPGGAGNGTPYLFHRCAADQRGTRAPTRSWCWRPAGSSPKALTTN